MFRELAERMAPDFPFYGIQAQGLDGGKNYLRTVEEMAEAYLKEVKHMQPEGPYYLGGFCLGGQVAFEMAKLLEKARREESRCWASSIRTTSRASDWIYRLPSGYRPCANRFRSTS